MTGNEIPEDDHVVRYVKPSLIDGETVDGGAFVLKLSETGLSVNWLEVLVGNGHDKQLDEVRRLSRLGMSKNGRFAKLNVGDTKQYISDNAEASGISMVLNITEAPLAATHQFEADPSHAEITGLPLIDSDEAMLIGDLISACIQGSLYHAIDN
ncbi:MAG: hypothetical protein OXC05_03315 [Halieaceae bacterium]|nr:hypothetical protein [Halieaceae bacterium]